MWSARLAGSVEAVLMRWRSGTCVRSSCTPSFSYATTQYRHFRSSAIALYDNVLSGLPDRVTLKTGPIGRLSKVLPPRQSAAITTRVGSSFGGHHSLQWCEQPRNILLVKKQRDAKTSDALKNVIAHIRQSYPSMNVIIEKEEGTDHGHDIEDAQVLSFEGREKHLLASKVDIVVTLGGDGTILHVSSLFDQSDVPPVLSFSMGTLGFLLPFHIDAFATAFADVIGSRSSLLLRMRLHQSTHNADGTLIIKQQQDESNQRRTADVHLMNEVALHRASSPHMTTIDAYVDGRHLTRAISDGLIIATPTGSTAYSLSAGGPIVHPSVQSLLLTPICPRSLSFRPVMLPSDAHIQLKVSTRSRASAQVSVDGREVQALEPGQYLQVAMSPFPIPCVNRGATSTSSPLGIDYELQSEQNFTKNSAASSHSDRGEDDWVGDINTLLRFNASFSGRGLLGGHDSGEESEELHDVCLAESKKR